MAQIAYNELILYPVSINTFRKTIYQGINLDINLEISFIFAAQNVPLKNEIV